VRVIRDDDRSASRTAKRQREGFDEVLLSVRRRQADLLICWEASRAARDLNAFLRLRDACAESGVGYEARLGTGRRRRRPRGLVVHRLPNVMHGHGLSVADDGDSTSR
jgi:hypothetical protein